MKVIPKRSYSILFWGAYTFDQDFQNAKDIHADAVILNYPLKNVTNAQVASIEAAGIRTILLFQPTDDNNTKMHYNLAIPAMAATRLKALTDLITALPACSAVMFEEPKVTITDASAVGSAFTSNKAALTAWFKTASVALRAAGKGISFNAPSLNEPDVSNAGIDPVEIDRLGIMDFVGLQTPGTSSVLEVNNAVSRWQNWMPNTVVIPCAYGEDAGQNGSTGTAACQAWVNDKVNNPSGYIANYACWAHNFALIIQDFNERQGRGVNITQMLWHMPADWFNIPTGYSQYATGTTPMKNIVSNVPMKAGTIIPTALDIRSTPGAAIRIDYNDGTGYGNFGVTPRIKELPPGTYTVELTAPGFPVWTSSPINLGAGQTIMVENTFNATGALDIKSGPVGAELFVDGVSKGLTDLILTLGTGTHSIKLSKQGFEDVTDTISIQANSTTVKEYTLKPIKTNSPVTIYLKYSVTEVYGEYTIEVSAIRFSGGKWLTSDDPDAEMRAYAKSKIPDIIGRDMISTDVLYINGIIQKANPPKEGDVRTVNCPKNGLPIQQIFRDGQWRTLDVDVHICGETEADYVALALKAGVVYTVLSSLLG